MVSITRESIGHAIRGKPLSYVHQFGAGLGTGFSADYCWFLTLLIKCLQFEIGFYLGKVTTPRGFSIENGWADYFKVFFDTVEAPFLQSLNIKTFPFSRKIPILKSFTGSYLKAFTRPHADYFMFDDLGELMQLGPPFFDENQVFASACQEIIRALWVYNEPTQRVVDLYRRGMPMPNDYSALCIRRGDKINEHDYIAAEHFVENLYEISPSKTIFVATDDHRVLGELADIAPTFDFLSITQEDSKGYNHHEFSNLPKDLRANSTARFFAQIEICRDASHFFGDRTTNVSELINFHRGGLGVTWIGDNL